MRRFDREAIVRFFSGTGYRPDLMAVVAVGDIDVVQMEAKIKSHFGGVQNPEKPRDREEFDIPDNKEPLVAIASDPEATNIIFNIIFKTDTQEASTEEDFRKSFVRNLFLSMMNQRLSDLLSNSNPPYFVCSD